MIKINENFANSQIDPSVLAPKSDLHPKIWNLKTKKLNDNIKLKLKQIANDFIRGFKYPLNIKDIISLISNGSVVLSIQSISEKIRSAKAFERVFNIAFDDQDFIIDTAKMSSTTSGRAFLISRQFNRIVNPLTNKLNDDYYRNNSFKIDSYHIQLEAQFIRL